MAKGLNCCCVVVGVGHMENGDIAAMRELSYAGKRRLSVRLSATAR